jgi:hypothetical protein
MSVPGPVPGFELPSTRRLLRSTAIAAAVAAGILVTTVLPAEYGVDPTGIGRMLGLTQMGEIKMQLAREAASAAAEPAVVTSAGAEATGLAATPVPSAPTPPAGKSDVTEVILHPNPASGKEIKLVMRKGAHVNYSWAVNQGVVNYDTHGDSPTTNYHGYAKATAVKADSGLLTAAFDGHHGWYWRNRGTDTVVVTLRTSGDYSELKRLP